MTSTRIDIIKAELGEWEEEDYALQVLLENASEETLQKLEAYIAEMQHQDRDN
jgi:hypothetical protein